MSARTSLRWGRTSTAAGVRISKQWLSKSWTGLMLRSIHPSGNECPGWIPHKSVYALWSQDQWICLQMHLITAMESLLTLPPTNLIVCTPIFLTNLIHSCPSFPSKPSLKAFLFLPFPLELLPLTTLSCFLCQSQLVLAPPFFFPSNNCYLKENFSFQHLIRLCGAEAGGSRVQSQPGLPRETVSKQTNREPKTLQYSAHSQFFSIPAPWETWACYHHTLSCTLVPPAKFGCLQIDFW